jgi:hypothetical protein
MKYFGAPSVRDILKVTSVCAVAGVRNGDVAVISRVSADNRRISFFDKFHQEYGLTSVDIKESKRSES